MKNIALAFAFTASVFYLNGCEVPQSPQAVSADYYDNGMVGPRYKKKPELIVAVTGNCVWCDRLKAEIKSIQSSGRWKGLVVSYRMDIQGVASYPHTFLMDSSGNQTYAFSGYRDRKFLIDAVRTRLGVN